MEMLKRRMLKVVVMEMVVSIEFVMTRGRKIWKDRSSIVGVGAIGMSCRRGSRCSYNRAGGYRGC